MVTSIELTFPGQVRYEVHAEPPFYRSAQMATAYSIAMDAGVEGVNRGLTGKTRFCTL